MNYTFKDEPKINVIDKDEFEKRVEKVFHILWETLSKSFGPYGAPTIICNYPYRHVTKDGYTIMKNLSFNAAETNVDQAIADMAGDICGRLNYSVGDGTTTAIIATNEIYQKYRENAEKLAEMQVLPREVLQRFDVLKDVILSSLSERAVPIKTDDKDELYKRIHDVVYISSNADEVITEYISDLYRELGVPAITCTKAADGVTRKTLIEGYKNTLVLNDRLYINNDNKTCDIDDADVIIFGTKVTEATYKHILKPLNFECASRGRRLIVCAPIYDELALSQVIAPELNIEYKTKKTVNMILTTYRAATAHNRKLINDFSVLMNTTVIDRAREQDIIERITSSKNSIDEIFNIDDRKIKGTKCIAINTSNEAETKAVTYTYGEDDEEIKMKGFVNLAEANGLIDNNITLGFVRKASLGLTESIFTELVYDEERYKVILKEAEDILAETEAKYQKLGTFNVEVSMCQERLYALRLKMGVIEVGADSELAQSFLKDSVDDAIKAAESAYKYGVVQGCNLDLIKAIDTTLVKVNPNGLDYILLTILRDGFKAVYRTVLTNGRVSNPDYVIDGSIRDNMVYDLSEGKYTTSVINSMQTDREVLKATIDLIGLLIVGNQMVVTQKHNFQD